MRATGNLRPTNQVDVGAEVTGPLDSVLVDVNDRVTKGQVIAVINTEIIDQQIAQSRANLNAARAALADTGMVAARESAALEAAYWSQLVGNFAWRARPAPASSISC